MTKFEIKTITDIKASLVEMIRIIQTNNANLNTRDRARIADALKKISIKEDLFLKTEPIAKVCFPSLLYLKV